MAKKDKTLCKWKQDEIEKNFDALRDMVANPKYVCRRCGRAVAKKKWVCKPAPLGVKA